MRRWRSMWSTAPGSRPCFLRCTFTPSTGRPHRLGIDPVAGSPDNFKVLQVACNYAGFWPLPMSLSWQEICHRPAPGRPQRSGVFNTDNLH